MCKSIVMKSVRVANFGSPEVLQVLEGIAVPKPSCKEVLINVKAAGINPVDTYIRSGTFAIKPSLPYTPGRDGAGVICEVGPEVTKFKVGDRVWFYESLSGAFAEKSLCSESKVFPLPETVDFDCHARAGESVLVHGASGAVGVAACQLADRAGLRVLGTAGSDNGMELLKSIGVKEMFNHKSEGYTKEIMAATFSQGVDVIIEMLANVNLGKDLQILKRNGRVGVIYRCNEAKAKYPEEIDESVAFITRGLEKSLLPVIGKEYTMKEVSVAHVEIIENNGAKGKTVLLI